MQKVQSENTVGNGKIIYIYTIGWMKPSLGMDTQLIECLDITLKVFLRWRKYPEGYSIPDNV